MPSFPKLGHLNRCIDMIRPFNQLLIYLPRSKDRRSNDKGISCQGHMSIQSQYICRDKPRFRRNTGTCPWAQIHFTENSLHKMLFTNFITAMTAFSGMNNHHLLSRQDACTTECAVALNATVSCGPSPDPYCGCADLVPSAPNCTQCLTASNTTLLGFLNSSALNFLVAVCNCQIPSCRDLILAEKACALKNQSNPMCTCPATAKDGPDCYPCLKQQDPALAQSLDGLVGYCQSLVNASTSASASASSGGSATASASASSTAFSSDAVAITSTSAWIMFLFLSFILIEII